MNEKVYQLAKDLFLKAEKPSAMLNDNSKPMYVKTIKNCIETAKLFYETYKEETKQSTDPYEY